MSIRKSIPAALCLVVAAGSLAPALAAPAKPKPITGKYALELLPVPVPLVGQSPEPANSCVADQLEGISTDTREIKVAGPGVLDVKVTKFSGDWDITVRSGATVLGIGAGTTTGDPSGLGTDNTETIAIKVRKAGVLKLGVCNFLGGPTANVEFVFKYS